VEHRLEGRPRGAVTDSAAVPAASPRSVSLVTAQPPQLDELDPADWGPAPSEAQVAAAAKANRALIRQHERQLRAGCIGPEAAAELAHTTIDRVRDLIAHGDLATLDTNPGLIPAWQLAPGLPDGVLPGLSELRRAFPGGLAALTRWVTRPSAEFDGRRPRDLMAIGEAADVISYARILTAVG
jgi:hypothetical protein